jgi:hypothetical protein
MSNGKYVENENVGVGGGARVWVKAKGVCLYIYFHSQLFSLSAFVPFLFSTLFGGIFFLFQMIFSFLIKAAYRECARNITAATTNSNDDLNKVKRIIHLIIK